MLHTVDTLVEVDGMIWHAIHGMFSTHFCKHNNMYNVLWCVCVCVSLYAVRYGMLWKLQVLYVTVGVGYIIEQLIMQQHTICIRT
jgi:hypothetical protein